MTSNTKTYLLFFLSYNITMCIAKASPAGAPVHTVAFLFLASASFQRNSESILFFFSYNILVVKWWEMNLTILLFNDTYHIEIIFY